MIPMSNGISATDSNCTCGSVVRLHQPNCPDHVEDDSGPLLLEDILNAKRILL